MQSIKFDCARNDTKTTYLVKVCCKSPEFQKVVLFQPLCECNIIKVVETVDGVAQGFVVLLFDEEIVVSIVDGLDVQL